MDPMHSTAQTKAVTPDNVRDFLLTRYSEPITAMQLNLADLPDDFDFLTSGVIDSFGILEMISAIEAEFRIQVDLALLDAEDITRIGSLARYIAHSASGK
jgi:acyl carrier protein